MNDNNEVSVNKPLEASPHTDGGILVVDDSMESLRLLTDILRQGGYEVRSTTNPRLALETARDDPPELLLLDVKMPDMDGFELCQLLKEQERTANIPVIFVSSLQETRKRVRGFEVGGVDFITKPLQREDILARVSRTLELEQMRKQLADMVEEKTHELALDEQRFEALYELSTMSDGNDGKSVAFALEAAVAMTCSEVGYIHFVNINRQNIDLFQWSRKTLEQCTAESTMHYPLEEAGIWADCIRLGRPVIHNDYPAMDEKHGLPEGHFPVRRHMSVPIYDQEKIVAIIGVGNKEAPYDHADSRQLSLFGSGVWSIIRQERSAKKLHAALLQTIKSIANTVEKRDPYTAGHQRRVADLACAIAEEMEIDSDTIEGIRMGGMIHDIGKIHIPAEILNRPGKLMDYEFSMIRSHPEIGYEIIREAEFPWPVSKIVHQHHERLDGSGYPQGLRGEEICLEARILAVADVVEAMATHRPYRPALSLDKALGEIEQGSGRLYDPQVVSACLRLFREQGYKIADAMGN